MQGAVRKEDAPEPPFWASEERDNAAMQEFMARTWREIPLLEQEEHLEADWRYDEELEARRCVRLGSPRRGHERCTGPGASKWRFLEGGETGVGSADRAHLVAMHSDYKTAVALCHMTTDAACRFMPNRDGPAYMLFNDGSCAETDYWLPDNITGTPGVNFDPEEPPRLAAGMA